MLEPRQRNPIIPGNPRERTGSAGILRRALAAIRRRFAGLEREVLALFDAIPILGGNDLTPQPRTAYMLTPEQLAALSAELQRALDRWIASGREPASVFWWSAFDAEAAQLGAAQSVANLSALAPAYAAQRALQQVLFSEPYRNRLAAAQVRSMDHWTGLGSTLRAELSAVIGRAVVDGKNPRAVRTEIRERLGVSKARAELYAQTDITGTLREARWAEADHAREEMGLDLAMLWTSAFLPTTRPHHASRHGRAYSTEEVRDFYARDGNRYRCHCAQTEALLDDEGAPILSQQLRRTMTREREVWQREHNDRKPAMNSSQTNARIIIVGGPRCGKSTTARTLRLQGYPTFCGDPLSRVKEPEEGVTYLPEGLPFSGDQGSASWVAENWFSMPGPWVCEGQVMARALRRWLSMHGTDAPPPADRIIVLATVHPNATPTAGQLAMGKGVMTVWREIESFFAGIVDSQEPEAVS